VITDYTPSTDDLAQLLPSRAAGRFTGGADAPAFPDTDRVEAVIADAVGLVAPALGGDELDERFYPAAKALIKLQAALILEPSAWPEQARPDKSAFAQWMELLNTRMTDTVQAIIRFRDDQDDAPGSSQHVLASFPPPGLLPAPRVDIWGNPLPLQRDGCGGVDW
jgi:hypothetical protein